MTKHITERTEFPGVRRNGRWKEFNKHAVLIADGNYVDGMKEGTWREYYDFGGLMIEENYVGGVQHGRFASYHPNGQLLSEGYFKCGQREGDFRVFSEEGIHVKTLCFKGDVKIKEIEHAPNTSLFSEEPVSQINAIGNNKINLNLN